MHPHPATRSLLLLAAAILLLFAVAGALLQAGGATLRIGSLELGGALLVLTPAALCLTAAALAYALVWSHVRPEDTPTPAPEKPESHAERARRLQDYAAEQREWARELGAQADSLAGAKEALREVRGNTRQTREQLAEATRLLAEMEKRTANLSGSGQEMRELFEALTKSCAQVEAEAATLARLHDSANGAQVRREAAGRLREAVHELRRHLKLGKGMAALAQVGHSSLEGDRKRLAALLAKVESGTEGLEKETDTLSRRTWEIARLNLKIIQKLPRGGVSKGPAPLGPAGQPEAYRPLKLQFDPREEDASSPVIKGFTPKFPPVSPASHEEESEAWKRKIEERFKGPSDLN